ncbi:MAG: FAD/NAD(P)-binding protein, partial [Calditrichaceae bacterium]
MKTISIIGAGLSGTLLAMNLLQKARKKAVNIKLIDRNPKEHLGPAYSTDEDYLLNVPVEIMGAFSADPAHFLKWTRSKSISATEGDYMPRKLYRQYIHSMLKNALNNKYRQTKFERIQQDIIDVNRNINNSWILVTGKGKIETDKLVLALGNSLPKNLKIKNTSFTNHTRYIRNPWKPDLLKKIHKFDNILFIGSGQTMVDLATGLYKDKYKGKMTSI